jgi:hypothetical protein
MVQYSIPGWIRDLSNQDPVIQHVHIYGISLGILFRMLSSDAESVGSDSKMGCFCVFRLHLLNIFDLCFLFYACESFRKW